MTGPGGEEFEAFARDHIPALLRFGHLLTGDRASAEDLVQTSLARTALRWHRLREPAAAPAYVRRAMVRHHANLVHRLLSRERVVAEPPDRLAAGGYAEVDERDAMWRALARIGPRQRAVLVLRYYEQLSEAETAAALGITTGTVKSQTARGLTRLRHVLAEPDPETHPEEAAWTP